MFTKKFGIMNKCSLSLHKITTMARTVKNRLIQMAPHFCGFTPYGNLRKNLNEVHIDFAEYEALKLCDYELLTQAEAAKIMNVSRPTFTRIYESVRRKIALAFIDGSNITFEEGKVDIADWKKCENCKITFTITNTDNTVCPFCKGIISKG